MCSIYWKYIPEKSTGRPALNHRIVLGATIIKHLCDLDDRETVDQISENIYMQYFLGYSSFCDVPPFDASLFVEFRKRLGLEEINKINERISKIKQDLENKNHNKGKDSPKNNSQVQDGITHKGSLITDATACPQDISFLTDIDFLNDSREKSEELMDILFKVSSMEKKPRNNREKARKEYLKVAQKKTNSRKDTSKAQKQQLSYLKINIDSINKILNTLTGIPLDKKQFKYLLYHLCI